MGVNASNVLVGAPDQVVTGAILTAPKGTTLPTNASASIPVAFKDSGYINEDGIQLTLDRSTNDIKDWSGATVRTVLESFNGTISWKHLETNEQSLRNTFGDENVTVTPSTSSHGFQMKVAIGAREMPRQEFVFKMKDGLTKVLIVIPDGQVTDTDDIAFKGTEAIELGVTLSCYPDALGNSIYIYTDDGVTTA